MCGATVSLVIPGLNVENSVYKTVTEALSLGRDLFSAFEIILVNDGSHDSTAEIMKALADKNKEIIFIDRKTCLGLAETFRESIKIARYEYLSLIPGDNSYEVASLRKVYSLVGCADVIITYRENQKNFRAAGRFYLSRMFSWTMSRLFGLSLRDVHSLYVYPTYLLKKINLRSERFGYHIEALVKVMFSGASVCQVPVNLNPPDSGKSVSLRWKTLNDLIWCVLYLQWYRLTTKTKRGENFIRI